MTRDEKLKEEQALIALVKKWPKRLKALSKRKGDPLDEAAFCTRYGFEKTGFNRTKNLKVRIKADRVNPVEAAFAAEGV